MKLQSLQSMFAKHIIDRAIPDEAEGFFSQFAGEKDALNERFGVYIDSVHLSLGATLKSNFPTVTSLVGDDFMAQLCREYTLLHPPSSGSLNRYGEADFPYFLKTVQALDELPYLPDVARLDAAVNRAFHSNKRTGLSAEDLALRFSDPENAHLLLNTPVSFISSPYPILSLRNYCLGDTQEVGFSMDRVGESVLVTRDDHDIVIREISIAQFEFLNACKEQMTVPKAIDHVITNHPDDDFREMFVEFLKIEIFV